MFTQKIILVFRGHWYSGDGIPGDGIPRYSGDGIPGTSYLISYFFSSAVNENATTVASPCFAWGQAAGNHWLKLRFDSTILTGC